MHKSVLITGANKSIGYETARRLGAEGFRVWLGARDEGRGEAAAARLRALGHDVRWIRIAVEDQDLVTAAAERVKQEDGRLDVLINNAGIAGTYADPLNETIADIRRVYDVNVFGPIMMVQAFRPLLEAAGAAHVINVSSGLGSLAFMTDPDNPFYGANLLGYNSSKTALNAVTVSLAKAMAPFNIRVNSTNPGFVKTDFNNHAGHRSVEDAVEIMVGLALSGPDGPNAGFFDDEGALPW